MAADRRIPPAQACLQVQAEGEGKLSVTQQQVLDSLAKIMTPRGVPLTERGDVEVTSKK